MAIESFFSQLLLPLWLLGHSPLQSCILYCERVEDQHTDWWPERQQALEQGLQEAGPEGYRGLFLSLSMSEYPYPPLTGLVIVFCTLLTLQRANILKEVQIMRGIDHPGIVKLLNFFESEEHYFLILECKLVNS